MATINRRSFLSTSVGSAASAAALTAARPARARGANERINLALVGCGGRGSGVAANHNRRDDVAITWLCDLDDNRSGRLADRLKKNGRKPETSKHLQQVLDDKSLDGIIIATPDHWHGPMTILACQAEKDVYVEKPPSHNVWEGRKMVEAARKYKRVVQVGTQNRSAPFVIKALDYIQSGKLGTIHLCKVYNLKDGKRFRIYDDSAPPAGFDHDAWLGPAPERPYNTTVFHGGWHKFWAYSGGDAADDGVHQLDIARMLVGAGFPTAIHCTGGNLAFHDDREVPDTQVANYEFERMVMTFELTQWAPYMHKTAGAIRGSDRFPVWMQNATRVEIYGTKNMMVVGRHGGGWQVTTGEGKVIAQEFGRPGDTPHRDNFLDCIRSRNKPNADIEDGHRSAVLVHTANIAYRVGHRKLTFDPATERFTGPGADQPNELVKRKYRKAYEVPENV